jgi:hypothetical protein
MPHFRRPPSTAEHFLKPIDDASSSDGTTTHQLESWVNFDLDDRGLWVVAVRFVPDTVGALVAAEVRVFPNERVQTDPPTMSNDARARGEWSHDLTSIPTGGVRTRDLRAVKLETHLSSMRWVARQTLLEHVDRLADGDNYRFSEHELRSWRLALVDPEVLAKGRGEEISDLDYARIAALYVGACETGSRRPNAEVAEQLGEGWDATRVKEWVRRCRSRPKRLLTEAAQRGVPGGRLTDKAVRLLENDTRGTGDSGYN